MINWRKLEDRHIHGTSSMGDWWIRVDRESKVIGVYKTFGETEKWVPSCKHEETIAGAKELAELQLSIIIEAETLAKKQAR